MEPGILRDSLTLVLGVITGVLSGLFGVGGATVSTPGIRILGASALAAVGTTLPSIFPSAVSGTARYLREKLIDWRVVLWAAPVGLATSVGGSLLSHAVPGNGHLLMIATAALLGLTAWRMARPPAPAVRPSTAAEAEAEGAVDMAVEPHPRAAGAPHATPGVLVAIGAAAGLLSGLLGIGGGVVMVPGFSEMARLPLKTAIASSLLCVAAFAVPGTITHWALNDIDWHFAIPLAIGVIPGARLGAALAIRTADRRLRTIVALFLGITAVIYATGEIIALVK